MVTGTIFRYTLRSHALVHLAVQRKHGEQEVNHPRSFVRRSALGLLTGLRLPNFSPTCAPEINPTLCCCLIEQINHKHDQYFSFGGTFSLAQRLHEVRWAD